MNDQCTLHFVPADPRTFNIGKLHEHEKMTVLVTENIISETFQ